MLRWLGILLVLLGVGGLALTPWLRGRSEEYGVPRWQVAIGFVTIGPGVIWCRVVGCDPELPEGMTLTAFVPEPYQRTAVALDVDPWGRVYVAESERLNHGAEDNRFVDYWLMDDLASRTVEDRRAYIEKWSTRPQGKPLSWFTERADRVEVYEDRDGDGQADASHTLAEFRDVVTGLGSGVLVDGDAVWYTGVPSLWRLRDADGDGVAEEREALHTGFGVKTSLVGHDLHGLVFGPDGKLYFSMGDRGYHVRTPEGRVLEPDLTPGRGAVFRMNPDGSGLEVFATGLRNPQELAFDDFGNLFTGDNNGDGGDKARIVYVAEGGETGWMMPYQTLEDPYLLGPWNAERIWELAHGGQPAYVLPPVAHLAQGPAGLAAYPGLGLPERYQGHFFLCDYRYTPLQSGIWSFAPRPRGAGFEVQDAHIFIGTILATDLVFGADGRIWLSEFDQFGGRVSRISRAEHAEARADPRVEEAARLLREGFGERDTGELLSLLESPDRRVRLASQFELARRGEALALAAVANDRSRPLLARLHAVWGLGQLGETGVAAAGWSDLAWLAEEAPALRGQVLAVLGETGSKRLGPALVPFLADGDDRVRYFAAIALGRLAPPQAPGALVELLRANANRDPFLRHAAVYGLYLLGDVAGVLAWADDPSPAVRMGVLLVLRRAADPRIDRYLRDPEPRLVVEAARAVYDLPIEDALPALAALAGTALPYRDDDPQTSHALHRRVLAASLRLGTADAALRIAAHAADPRNPRAMRELALDTLAQFARPEPREPVHGMYRPLPERDPALVHPALDRYVPELLEGPLEARALKVALAYDRVPLASEDLLARVRSRREAAPTRVASLQALAARIPGADGALGEALEAALDSREPELRAEARDLLAERAPARALAALDAVAPGAPLAERQRALAALARIAGAEADRRLVERLRALAAGELDPALALDVLEAARAREDGAVAQALAAYEADLAARPDPLAAYGFALQGGDARRGQRVFQSAGDCQRCHGLGGRGGGVGPELKGVARRRDRAYLLESVLDPQARIAEGFASVSITRRDGRILSGTLVREGPDAVVLEVAGQPTEIPRGEIAHQTAPSSGMPPMGLALSPRELRDLVAYLATL